MKPLGKKLCISVWLEQLFEAVEDEDEGIDRDRRGATSLVRSRIPVPQEEFFLRRTNRCRKYRNEWLKFRKESYYYRSALQKLESEEDWRLIVETIRRRMKTSQREPKGDSYSISQLNSDRETGETRKKTTKMRVDIAVSTSFLTSSAMIVRKKVKTDPGRERGTSTREKVDVSTQTDREIGISHKANKFREARIAVYRYSAEYSMRNKVMNNIASNKKSFLTTGSVKRTNLSLRNHKSTQLGFEMRLSVEAFDRTKHKLTEIGNQDEKLEELFRCKKFAGNALRRGVQLKKNQLLGKGLNRGRVRSRVSSESRIAQQRSDALIRKRSRVSCSSRSSEDCSKNQAFENPKMNAPAENFLCYTMRVPWEMNPFDRISNLREFGHLTEEGDIFLEHSFNPFRATYWPEPEVNSFRMETECEIFPTRDRPVATDDQEPETKACTVEKETVEEVQMEVAEKKSEKLLPRETSNSDESIYLRQMILQALGPQIMEEVKQLSMREELSRSMGESSHPGGKETSREEVTLEWELEIEIQSHDTGNMTTWRQLVKKNSNRLMSTATTEDPTDVLLLRPSTSRFHAMSDSSSQQSSGSEVEECYLRDKKLSKLYRVNVPRHLLRATEQRLKHVGRR